MKISEDGNGVRLRVYVQPRGAKNEILGMQGDALKIRVTSPPVEGAANHELTRFLAGLLDVPRSRIEILTGHKSRYKTIRISDASPEQIQAILSPKSTT